MRFTKKERDYLELDKFGKHPKSERDNWEDLNFKWVLWMKEVNRLQRFFDFIINESGEICFCDI